MAMITDLDYALQAIRLSTLRHCTDSTTSRLLTLPPNFALNPYIAASGLADLDRWPEIPRALDSPPLSPPSSYEDSRPRRRGASEGERDRAGGGGGGGLKYTQTIMGGKTGGLGMRVTGRRGGRTLGGQQTGPPSPAPRDDAERRRRKTSGKLPLPVEEDGFFSPGRRPRADSAPASGLLLAGGSGPRVAAGVGSLILSRGTETALSTSSLDAEGEGEGEADEVDLEEMTGPQPRDEGGSLLNPEGVVVDEGSDGEEGIVVEDEDEESHHPKLGYGREDPMPDTPLEPPMEFFPLPVVAAQPPASALTALLNKHIPHLVSTSKPAASSSQSSIPTSAQSPNPFSSLYASVAAPSHLPFTTLELFFPHSAEPGKPIGVKVRKDASVEEVTGYGLLRYWEEGREPRLQDEEEGEDGMEGSIRLSSVGWGLRIVEDDGEVDEDFPPLDRDSQVSKFSYGQFAIVPATEAQIKQNIAKAPMIVRRPSRVIAPPLRTRPSEQGRPKLPAFQSSNSGNNEGFGASSVPMKGSLGLSSALSRPVLLRVRVTASADVHFTTTISVPTDMYIADLTDVLHRKKRLPPPSSDWVLCLADLTLALPLDRTVASLEGKTELALVRRAWAVEHGLRIDDRRGGDPSQSIFRRQSEVPRGAGAALGAAGVGVGAGLGGGYKKFTVWRRIAIGRHERVLAIDGDYIHIMPSESRAFFDSMKTTSFHITLVASCKLTSGKAGGFKINVWREGGQKRYEFEAENGRQAAEIVSSIRAVMKQYPGERNSMMPPPRVMPRR